MVRLYRERRRDDEIEMKLRDEIVSIMQIKKHFPHIFDTS
jgi:hypothetical protein